VYSIGPHYALDAVEERADGLLHVPFVLTAPGSYPYSVDGRRIMVLKPPEHWHSETFLRSAQGAPFTFEHPREMVTPDSKRDIMGLADSGPATVMADGRVRHGATVFDADLILAIKQKKLRSVSGGYWVDLKSLSGVWTDSSGRAHVYDAVQTNPRVNHIAAVKNPRVKNADILLDSEHRAIWCLDQDDTMEIDAIIAKLSTIDAAAVDALTALLAARDSDLEALRKLYDGLRGERDGLLQKLEKAPTTDSIDGQVRSRLGAVAQVATKTGATLDSLLDAKDNRDLYIRGLTHLKVKFSTDESEDYLRCLVDTHALAPGKSAADAIASQPQAAVDPHKAAAERIKTAQAKELAEIKAAQRGNK
jgi:hypothetical protein